MAELYRFFASSGGDTREYTQIDWAEVISTIFREGVAPGVGDRLAVVPTDPPSMAVIVRSGVAMFQGYWYRNTTSKEIMIQVAHPTLPRIDRIVLRLDINVDRKIEALAKTGTPASQPSPPPLEQNTNYWEFSLAQLYVAASATQITADDITDERVFAAQARNIYLSPNPPGSTQGSEGDIWIQWG